MLPPGIFLWESGHEDMVSSIDFASLSASHPTWAEDVATFGPWEKALTVDGFGRFSKSSQASEATVVVVGECGTTMETARMLLENGVLGEWGAVLSMAQTSGRGQLRRPWVSPPGNVHLSVVLPAAPLAGPWRDALIDLLPLVAGYVLRDVLNDLGANIQIKWPNDLLQDDKKVGGILIEEKNGVVILGFGLNHVESPPDAMMREDHSVSAGVLQTKNRSGGPLALGATLVNRGKIVYTSLFDEMEPSQFLSLIRRQLAWFGQRVEVREGEKDSYYAEIVGISPKGGLVVRREGRESVLFSGSIYPL